MVRYKSTRFSVPGCHSYDPNEDREVQTWMTVTHRVLCVTTVKSYRNIIHPTLHFFWVRSRNPSWDLCYKESLDQELLFWSGPARKITGYNVKWLKILSLLQKRIMRTKIPKNWWNTQTQTGMCWCKYCIFTIFSHVGTVLKKQDLWWLF